MRISTSQIYDAGTLGIQRNQQGLFSLQNQLSTGRRVLTPEDDPVAAAQALILSQAKSIGEQYIDNQNNARAQLNVLESNVESVETILLNVRDRIIQAGNTVLTNAERKFFAQELEVRLDELLAVANSTDGSGQFLFSGYQGMTRPFAINPAAPIIPPSQEPPVNYSGDEGERVLHVSSSRLMPVNVSGADVFMNIRSGNGTFATGVGGANLGTGVIDGGSVSDPAAWAAAVNAESGAGFRIEFLAGGGYQVVGATTSNVYASDAAFTPGQAISFAGVQVVVKGTPAVGDTFTAKPSSSQSLFATMQNLVAVLNTPVGSGGQTVTEFANRMAAELLNVDRGLDNVSRVRAEIGSRLKELDSLANTAKDVDLQYAAALSDLQDLDYAEAISKFSQQQVQLEAAQKSFAQISGLSLFKIL